jgi:hypothetical protein
VTVGDPHLLVERFIQAIHDASAQNRGQTSTRLKAVERPGTNFNRQSTLSSSQAGLSGTRPKARISSRPTPVSQPPLSRNNSLYKPQGSKPTNPALRQSTWQPEIEQTILVRPAELDFGEVFPGISEAIPFSVAETHNKPVQGMLEPEHSWVRLNRHDFDGVHTVIYVEVDTTQIPEPGYYESSIIISPTDDVEVDQPVRIKVEVLELPKTKTLSPEKTKKRPFLQAPLPESNLPPLQDLANTNSRAALLQQHEAVAQVDTEQTRKYGQKHEKWEPLQLSTRTRTWYRQALAFCTSLMAAELPYNILPHLNQLSAISFLPPSPWFVILLLLMVPMATAGAILGAGNQKDLVNRLSTGLFLALSLVEIGKFIIQNVLNWHAPIQQLFIMLVLVATSATIGTNEGFSRRLLASTLFSMKHARWLVTAVAVFWGGLLGFGLTTGFAFGCLTGFGVALGIIAAVMLTLHLDRMSHTPEPSLE